MDRNNAIDGVEFDEDERRYLEEAGEAIERLDEAAPEAESAPEPEEPARSDVEEGAEPEAEDEGAEDRRVPLAELLKERKRAKEARQRYEQLVERLTKVAEAKTVQPEQPPAKVEQPAPDLQQDPFAYIEHLGQKVQTFEQQAAQEAQQRELDRIRVDFESRLSAREEQARQQWQDYDDRIAHVGQQVLNTYLFRGYDERAAAYYAQQEMKATAYNLAQQGVDPTEWFYRSAEERFGYRGQPVQQQAPGPDREKAKKAFRSPSHAGGSAPKAKRSAADLANMSDEEFMRWAAESNMSADDIAALTMQ